MVAAAAIACVTSFGRGDGVRDDDDPIDGIDNGDLFAIIIYLMHVLVNLFSISEFDWVLVLFFSPVSFFVVVVFDLLYFIRLVPFII